MATKKASRGSISRSVDNIFPHSRIRKLLDAHGINESVATEVDKAKDVLLTMKKAGGPAQPQRVTPIKRDASEADKAKHAEARAKYLQALKEYNDYTSPTFKKLVVAHSTIKHLAKLVKLLTPIVQHPTETNEQFKARQHKHAGSI